MGYLRFHRSMRLLPGVRMNLSKTGLSISLGVKGARVNLGSRGVRTTVGIPGSGFSYIDQEGWGPSRQGVQIDAPSQVPVDDGTGDPRSRPYMRAVLARLFIILVIPLVAVVSLWLS